ncbi:MAG: hypothetical protein ICV73_06845, partial [Acetobacteraceae bacterium]|nr:hypothetical protein [Acetobacteraceae bacterium]
MSSTLTRPTTAPVTAARGVPLPVITALLAFALLAAAIALGGAAMTGGHLGYTLDDPYIHLALAEQIARGHYGINPGEVTAPSSSVLWPFLLLPGAGTPWHVWLPLGI